MWVRFLPHQPVLAALERSPLWKAAVFPEGLARLFGDGLAVRHWVLAPATEVRLLLPELRIQSGMVQSVTTSDFESEEGGSIPPPRATKKHE